MTLVAPRVPGGGRDPALDHGDTQLLRPGSRRRVPDIAEREAARRAGLAGGLAFFQGLGGGISLEQGPARTRSSCSAPGPAGGAIGANELAKRMGKKRVLLGDMGGTSFDTGIIVDNEIHIEKNLSSARS